MIISTETEELADHLCSAQAKPFQKPKGAIRLSSTIDLSDPTSPYHTKAVLLAPVSKLPLQNATAIHRLKLLAGPRWSPGQPGKNENDFEDTKDDGEGKEGWVKISEETWKEGRMNRKSASDILERLVNAANVSLSWASFRFPDFQVVSNIG